MNMWKIYTGDRCTYCTNAKRLLNMENIPFAEHNINIDEKAKYYLKDNGYKTVPQIWNHRDEYVGGYDQLKTYFENTFWKDKKPKKNKDMKEIK